MEYDGNGMSALELIQYLWQRKSIILAMTALGAILGVVIALNLQPIYRAESVVSPVSGSESTDRFGALTQLGASVGLSLDSSSATKEIEKAKATLESRAFIGKFLEDNDLLPILFNTEWDQDQGTWVNDEGTAPSVWRAVGKFEKMLEVREDFVTSLISISIEWSDPKLASSWVNEIVRSLNEHIRIKDTEEAQKSLDYLRSQLESTNVVEMQQVLYNLIEAQTRTIMLANAREEYVFNVIDPAIAPEERVRPNRRFIALVGLIIGFMLSLGVIYIRELVGRQDKRP